MSNFPEVTTKVWHGLIYVGSFVTDTQTSVLSLLVVLPNNLPKDQEGRGFIVVPSATEVDELIAALVEHKTKAFGATQ